MDHYVILFLCFFGLSLICFILLADDRDGNSRPKSIFGSMTVRNPNPSLVRESMTTVRNPNHPNPSASVVEKTVYIRLCKNDSNGGKMDWYGIKLSNELIRERKRKRSGGEGYPPPVIEPIWNKVEETPAWITEPIWNKVETPAWSCCVALGSTIYSIGGCDEIDGYYSEEVRAANMSLRKFRYVASMNATRWHPHAVTADDKIYVFGGVDGGGKGPEIEVFDPINDIWESITPPSHPIPSLEYDGGFFVTYDEASKRIICASISTECLLAYDTKRGSWQSLDSAIDFTLKKSVTGAAVFENTLYWICVRREPLAELVVYDMDLRVSGSTIIVGLEGLLLTGRYDRPPLVHFRGGNEFLVIWHGAKKIGDPKGEEYHSLVRCATILVSKQVDRQNRKIRVKAQVFSTKTFVLPRLYTIMDAVVM